MINRHNLPSQEGDEYMESESLSGSSSSHSPSEVRINLRGAEGIDDEEERTRNVPNGRKSRSLGRGMMDVERRTNSLTASYLETEKEEDFIRRNQ